MKYEFKSRVRYSEIGEDRKLTLDGILNYFQDCTTFHSEEVGLGLSLIHICIADGGIFYMKAMVGAFFG